MLASSGRFGVLAGIVSAVRFTVTLAGPRHDRRVHQRLRLIRERRGSVHRAMPVQSRAADRRSPA
jgi:hypothetical protein